MTERIFVWMGNQIDMFKKRLDNVDYKEWKRNVEVRTKEELAFDGDTYEKDVDYKRLSTSLKKIKHIMSHPRGQWWTLFELAKLTGSSEAGVSARVRDLRKDKNGGHTIESARGRNGLWKYRMTR
jgi:hypothetical protein